MISKRVQEYLILIILTIMFNVIILYDVFIYRQIYSFIFIIIVPGFLLLRLLNIYYKKGIKNKIIYTRKSFIYDFLCPKNT